MINNEDLFLCIYILLIIKRFLLFLITFLNSERMDLPPLTPTYLHTYLLKWSNQTYLEVVYTVLTGEGFWNFPCYSLMFHVSSVVLYMPQGQSCYILIFLTCHLLLVFPGPKNDLRKILPQSRIWDLWDIPWHHLRSLIFRLKLKEKITWDFLGQCVHLEPYSKESDKYYQDLITSILYES